MEDNPGMSDPRGAAVSRPSRLTLAGLALAGFVAGAGAVALLLTSDVDDGGVAFAVLAVVITWAFIGTGLRAWQQRPESRVGALMVAVGFAWPLNALLLVDVPGVFVIGALANNVWVVLLFQLLLTFPEGRMRGREEWWLLGGAWLAGVGLQAARLLFLRTPDPEFCEKCATNPLLIVDSPTAVDVLFALQVLVGVPALAGLLVLLVRRWRGGTTAERSAFTPVVWAGGATMGLIGVQLVTQLANAPEAVSDAIFLLGLPFFAAVPFAFMAGVLRSRIGRAEELSSTLSAENEQLTAELRAKVEELRSSRARIVAAGYEERRRVERDLHDGAQQRLMAVNMGLRLARGKLDGEPELAGELLDEAMAELSEASAELRELARGIHPAVLTDRGLAAALSGLAGRSQVPVEIVETPAERLPGPIESATYFVIAEALTNVARYSEAGAATVRVARENGAVEVEVRDDGVGGANPAAGTGLRGLGDRVAALDGELTVDSPDGEGTTVRARIPCG
jgi:signal transduction histidine kinase